MENKWQLQGRPATPQKKQEKTIVKHKENHHFRIKKIKKIRKIKKIKKTSGPDPQPRKIRGRKSWMLQLLDSLLSDLTDRLIT